MGELFGSLTLTEKHGPVVAAFLAPNTSQWQGRAIQVTQDGTWWHSDLNGCGWEMLQPFKEAPRD